jgi:hypothetical protein
MKSLTRLPISIFRSGCRAFSKSSTPVSSKSRQSKPVTAIPNEKKVKPSSIHRPRKGSERVHEFTSAEAKEHGIIQLDNVQDIEELQIEFMDYCEKKKQDLLSKNASKEYSNLPFSLLYMETFYRDKAWKYFGTAMIEVSYVYILSPQAQFRLTLWLYEFFKGVQAKYASMEKESVSDWLMRYSQTYILIMKNALSQFGSSTYDHTYHTSPESAMNERIDILLRALYLVNSSESLEVFSHLYKVRNEVATSFGSTQFADKELTALSMHHWEALCELLGLQTKVVTRNSRDVAPLVWTSKALFVPPLQVGQMHSGPLHWATPFSDYFSFFEQALYSSSESYKDLKKGDTSSSPPSTSADGFDPPAAVIRLGKLSLPAYAITRTLVQEIVLLRRTSALLVSSNEYEPQALLSPSASSDEAPQTLQVNQHWVGFSSLSLQHAHSFHMQYIGGLQMGYAASGDPAYLYKLVEVASLIGDVLASSRDGFAWEPPDTDPRAGKSLEIPTIPSGSSFLVSTQRDGARSFAARVTQHDERAQSTLHPMLDAIFSCSILALRSLLVWGTSRSRPEILQILVERHASLSKRMNQEQLQELKLPPHPISNMVLTEVETGKLEGALLCRQVLFLERYLLPNMYRRSSINA